MTAVKRWIGLGIAGALLGAAGPARATLGEHQATVDRDRAALALKAGPSTARGGVTVHELAGSTATVREFADASGTVFAVAWSGQAPPDLAQLLGAYHAEYVAAAAGPRRARGPRRVEAPNVVVETWGHLRTLQGRAWLPSLVPLGASLDDVR
jgi:hypothetical protein